MKHVVVFEFSDDDTRTSQSIVEDLELCIADLEARYLCFAHTKYNVKSAIAATHEMFNAPEWKGGL